MDDIRISLVQMDLAWREKEANMAKVEQMVEGLQTDVIVLPEMFTTGFAVRHPEDGETLDGPAASFMAKLARSSKAVVMGSFMCKTEDGLFNRFLAMGPDGALGHYDKQHLFGLSHENAYFSAGDQVVDVEYKDWRFRLIVCYDLRFPYVSYNDSDYDALIVVANWPSMRISHWDALLRARAVENQSFVIAVNRVGMDPFDVSYPGHSSVYDPSGDLELRFTGEHVRTVILERDRLEAYREKLPFLKDRRV